LLIGEKASLSLSFPLWAEVEVMVLGGGPSGFAAALTAAEMGARTLLVEQHGFLGGMATAALVMPWNVWAKPVTTKDIGGVYGKLIGLLDKREGSFRFSPQTVLRSFHPAILKMGMDEMAIQAGVKILFHTLAVDTLREKERITAVVLQNKAGRGIVKAKTIVDATGDGDVAFHAGAKFLESKKSQLSQPGTLIFLMGGVHIPTMIDYLRAQPSEIGNWPPSDEMRFSDGEHICISGFSQAIDRAKNDGVPLVGNQLILCSTPIRGLVSVNITKIYGIEIQDPWSLSLAEIEARRQIGVATDFLKRYIPGFDCAYLADLAVQIGIRETRRVAGDTIMEMKGVRSGHYFSDRIARLFNVGHVDFTGTDSGGNPAVHFEYLAQDLLIPMGCLMVQGVDNLCISGRCISADPEVFGYIRTQTACFATGQAAGTLAALASRGEGGIREVPVRAVQQALTADGIELG
jgi:hypothetical protein